MDKKIHLNFSITSLSAERTKVQLTHLPSYLLDANKGSQKYVNPNNVWKDSFVCEDYTNSMN